MTKKKTTSRNFGGQGRKKPKNKPKNKTPFEGEKNGAAKNAKPRKTQSRKKRCKPINKASSSMQDRRIEMMEELKPQGKIPKRLPIERRETEILETIEKNQVTIIVGNTGCGKSTKIPQMLYRANYGEKRVIACTQPRRIAAWSLAHRVAEEMKTEVGKLVGYKVRFEDESSDETKILYLTDGSLVGASPSNFSRYSVLVVDEVHQRSLLTDVLLGLIKREIQSRKDFRIILSSATINAEQLSEYFGGAPILTIEGSPYDVEISYIPVKKGSYLGEVAMTVEKIAAGDMEGDILVFLPGKPQIDKITQRLKDDMEKNSRLRLHVVPAHAELAGWQLRNIYKKPPDGMRKVILSTNMSETSLTIENVVFVVDSGYVNTVQYEGRRGINHLSTIRCSKAEALQRRGRVGRTQNGFCYRLYSEETFEKEMLEIAQPEIERLELSGMILKLKSMNVGDLSTFDFLQAPDGENLKAGHDNLHRLKALGHGCELTQLGRLMARFPLEPNLTASLLRSTELGCMEEVLNICSMISAVTGFNIPKLSPLVSKMSPEPDPMDRNLCDFMNEIGDTIALGEILDYYDQFLDEETQNDYARRQWCKKNEMNDEKLYEAVLVFWEVYELLNQLELVEKNQKHADKYFGDLREYVHPLDQMELKSRLDRNIVRSLLEGHFYNLAQQTTPDASFLLRNQSKAKMRSYFLQHSEAKDFVFGLDLTAIQGGTPFAVAPTIVPSNFDFSEYQRRLRIFCPHCQWPVKTTSSKQKPKSSPKVKASSKKENVMTLDGDQLAVIEKLVTCVKSTLQGQAPFPL